MSKNTTTETGIWMRNRQKKAKKNPQVRMVNFVEWSRQLEAFERSPWDLREFPKKVHLLKGSHQDLGESQKKGPVLRENLRNPEESPKKVRVHEESRRDLGESQKKVPVLRENPRNLVESPKKVCVPKGNPRNLRDWQQRNHALKENLLELDHQIESRDNQALHQTEIKICNANLLRGNN